MRKVLAEFLTTDPSSPDSYGDPGCTLDALSHLPIVLRHEHYTDELQHKVYLFAREPECGAQVFIHIFPMPKGEAEYKKELDFYTEQRKDFRLPAGRNFDSSLLAPAISECFDSHTAFCTRDGKHRRRIVHGFVGRNRAVLLVCSLGSVDFLASKFFAHVSQHLKVSDTKFDGLGGKR
jgi:hypothetical protein